MERARTVPGDYSIPEIPSALPPSPRAPRPERRDFPCFRDLRTAVSRDSRVPGQFR